MGEVNDIIIPLTTNNGDRAYVRMCYFVYMSRNSEANETIVGFQHSDHIYVKETPEKILEMIQEANNGRSQT